MIGLTIDEKKIEVPEGTTVLRAAEMAGVKIPTLCDHPKLTPYGGCRLCLVEIDGFRQPQPSCTLPVSANMVVHTDTPKLRSAREFVLTMLFSERNHFCPFCQVTGGDCELQNAALDLGMTHWPIQPNWIKFPVDASNPYIVMEANRCILCRRCIRACAELVGNFTLNMSERGADCALVADSGVPLGESSCISCGMCVQVCPTGALIERDSAYRGHDVQLTHTSSVCLGCSVGCGVTLIARDNHLVHIDGKWDAAVNGGVLCKNGRYMPLDDKRERVTTPLVRKNKQGALEPATWEEALGVVANHLKPLVGKKNDGVAALASTRLPAEALSLFKQLFADQCKSEMVTSIEEGFPTALPAALADEMGRSFEGKLDALKTADCVVTIGADLAENHQVAGFFVKRVLPIGVNLVVVDPKENELDILTDYGVKATKGDTLDVLQGLTAAVSELGLAKSPVSGIDAKKVMEGLTAKTGLSIENVKKVALVMAGAKHPVIVYGRGITGNGDKATLKALLDLAQAIGALDDQHSGLLSVKGKANSMAASQYKLDKPFQVNGQQAGYVVLGDDEPNEYLVKRLEKLPFLAVQASYASKLTELADVVLPVEMWAEQSGHYLSLEGRLQEAHNAVTAPKEVRSNAAVLETLAKQLSLATSQDWKQALSQRVPVVPVTE